jgi:UDP-sugar pyrophosphorylase
MRQRVVNKSVAESIFVRCLHPLRSWKEKESLGLHLGVLWKRYYELYFFLIPFYTAVLLQDMKIDIHDQSTWPVMLQDNMSILNLEEKNIVRDLLVLGQQHLFATWDPKGINDSMKHKFFSQIQELNRSYPGGIAGYIKNAKKLLGSAKRGENPLEGWRPEIPHGVSLEPVTDEYVEYEQVGIPHLGACGFVLVAGGLGERLGYNGIKVELPSQTVTNTCYLELYCRQIIHIQNRYGAPGMLLPLAIMVSDDTHTKTQRLLESSNYFGLEKSQVTLLKQGKVPALLSNSAHIALATSYTIDAKPHGHGDVHSLMHTTGTARKWKNAGIKYIVFFQDTNGLGLYTLPAMLGVSEKLGLEVNSLAVSRYAKQAIGALARLIHTDGREMTVNVEYNQLDPLLRSTGHAQGDVNDLRTGVSPFPGNINQLLFRVDPYVKVLNRTDGVMPEFVNPKYTDSTKNLFKKPTRLECMMQDYPKLLGSDARVGFTRLPEWVCYSPVKNNPTDAAASVASGVPAASPFTAECDQYHIFAELLRRMGASIDTAAPLTILGITGTPAPRIVFQPNFAVFAHEIAERFPHPERIKITSGSTLVIEGDVVVDHLYLSGSAKISAAPGSRIVVRAHSDFGGENVVNEGHLLKVFKDEDSNGGRLPVLSGDVEPSEVDKMRGYMLECVDMCVAATGRENQKAAAKSAAAPSAANGAVPSAVAEATEEYVFTGRNLFGDDQVVHQEAEAADCECCNLTSCIAPEISRRSPKSQPEEEESPNQGDCSLVGFFIPELA